MRGGVCSRVGGGGGGDWVYAAISVLLGSGNSSDTEEGVCIGELMRTKLPVDVSEGVSAAVDDADSKVRSSSEDSAANGRA